MKLRVARHTSNLSSLIHFYHDLLGMQVIGSFKDHSGYDGVFIGFKGESWHLEFTVSGEKPEHSPDEDDLLVFYISGEDKFNSLIEKLRMSGAETAVPKNLYWKGNGLMFRDPDGFGVMIVHEDRDRKNEQN